MPSITRLFTREEPIAGLEINDTHLRLALLEATKEKVVVAPTPPQDATQKQKSNRRPKPKKETRTKMVVKALAEEQLSEEVVAEGAIKKKEEFASALKRLLKKTSAPVRYVILSIPANNVYTKVFSFPRAVRGQKLEATMQLTVGFQLPIKLENAYLDWEKVKTQDDLSESKVFLATIAKSIINDYLTAATSAGLKVVAVELHPMSLARVLEASPEQPTLIRMLGKSSATIAVVRNRATHFIRVLPYAFIPEKDISVEIEKIARFYETEYEPISAQFLPEEMRLIQPLSSHPEIQKESSKWIVSVGAAARGLIPRSEDELVSLLPVGTEEAYEYQKAATFAGFLSNLIVGLSLFFIAAFVGTWFFVISMQERLNAQLQNLALLPLPADAVETEKRAHRFNNLVGTANNLVEGVPQWSILLEELQLRVTPGIIITRVSLSAPEAVLYITGAAETRPQLNEFKKSLEASTMLTQISLPLTNLEQRNNIPFSISFTLQDPEALYYK